MSDTERKLRHALAEASAVLDYICEFMQEDPRGVDTFSDKPITHYRDRYRELAKGNDKGNL